MRNKCPKDLSSGYFGAMRLSMLLPGLLCCLPLQTPQERTVKNLQGWTVHVDPLLVSGPDAERGRLALSMLDNHLERIALLVSGEFLEELRKLEFVIEKDNPKIRGMQYHPDLKWLERRGHDPLLHKKVHIPQARELLSRAQLLKHPAVILHELAHRNFVPRFVAQPRDHALHLARAQQLCGEMLDHGRIRVAELQLGELVEDLRHRAHGR